jgi:hypothetical protein
MSDNGVELGVVDGPWTAVRHREQDKEVRARLDRLQGILAFAEAPTSAHLLAALGGDAATLRAWLPTVGGPGGVLWMTRVHGVLWVRGRPLRDKAWPGTPWRTAPDAAPVVETPVSAPRPTPLQRACAALQTVGAAAPPGHAAAKGYWHALVAGNHATKSAAFSLLVAAGAFVAADPQGRAYRFAGAVEVPRDPSALTPRAVTPDAGQRIRADLCAAGQRAEKGMPFSLVDWLTPIRGDHATKAAIFRHLLHEGLFERITDLDKRKYRYAYAGPPAPALEVVEEDAPDTSTLPDF